MFKRNNNAGAPMEVACGQCLGCRLDRSRIWAMRIIHESQQWDHNCFITLTYREPRDCSEQQLKDQHHVPEDGSLRKKHFQDFMKRLRKFSGTDQGKEYLAQDVTNRKIRYYQCGEYGDQLDRPHYHACLFNVRFMDQELFQQREGNLLFISETLEKLWPYGFSTIGELTFESAAYCARYVLKKVTGNKAHDHYLRFNPDTGEIYWLEPEYCTMSRRPGIGKTWYDQYKDDCFPSDETPVPGQGVIPKVPRYYEELLRIEQPDIYEEVKAARQKYRQAHAEEYTSDRLMAKYKVAKAKKDQFLIRGFEK